jgi:hypothetical protein
MLLDAGPPDSGPPPDGIGSDGGRAGPYVAGDLPSLRSILRQIAATLTGCVFDVPLVLNAGSQVEVRVDGAPVPHDPTRRVEAGSWDWSGLDRRSISLFGEACRSRIESNATVEAIVSCEPRDGG